MHDYNGDGYLDRGEAWALYEDDPLTDKQIEQQLDMVSYRADINFYMYREAQVYGDRYRKTQRPTGTATDTGTTDKDKRGTERTSTRGTDRDEIETDGHKQTRRRTKTVTGTATRGKRTPTRVAPSNSG